VHVWERRECVCVGERDSVCMDVREKEYVHKSTARALDMSVCERESVCERMNVCGCVYVYESTCINQ